MVVEMKTATPAEAVDQADEGNRCKKPKGCCTGLEALVGKQTHAVILIQADRERHNRAGSSERLWTQELLQRRGSAGAGSCRGPEFAPPNRRGSALGEPLPAGRSVSRDLRESAHLLSMAALSVIRRVLSRQLVRRCRSHRFGLVQIFAYQLL
jgi:hypothetical protein